MALPTGTRSDDELYSLKPFVHDGDTNIAIHTKSYIAENVLFAALTYQTSAPYAFGGFFQPVDNLPTLNSVKAGSAIPVKFTLGGDQTLNIFAVNSPSSQPVACGSTSPVDPIEQTVTAGGSSLSYDPLSQTYTYVWKTDKSWAGTCRQLNVTLKDGTKHMALFQFR